MAHRPGSGRPWALALGGGSARGFAHVGVLKVLAAEGVRPDMVTGTSMGSVIGALYAAGYSPGDMERLVLDLEPRRLLYLFGPRPSKTAMFDLRGFIDLMRDLLPPDFADLEIPFACVSTDLHTGTPVLHRQGDLVTAVRASVSIPVAFKPVRDDGRLLVDGGLVEPVPVDAARAIGARRVVAVSVNTIAQPQLNHAPWRHLSGEGRSPYKGGRWQIAAASLGILEHKIAQEALKRADLVITPKVEGYAQFAFTDAPAIIAAGEAAARESLQSILRIAR